MIYNYDRCRMMKRKRKIKYKNLIICLLILVVIGLSILLLNNKKKDNNIYMIDVINKNIDIVYQLLDKYDLDIDISYEYDENVLKDNVIAVTAKSCSFPERELNEAIDFCRQENIKHIILL